MRWIPTALMLVLALSACATAGTDGSPASEAPDRVPMEVELETGDRVMVVLNRDDQLVTGRLPVRVDRAWPHLLDTYASLGFELAHLAEYVPNARRVTVARRVAKFGSERPSAYLECGRSVTGQRADRSHVTVYLSTWLLPAEEGTTVVTRFEGSARDAAASRAASHCSSNGRLEARIARDLLARTLGAEHER